MPITSVNDPNTCQKYGLDVVLPQSRGHWKSLLQKYDAQNLNIYCM